MAFPGLRYASTGLLAALRVGSRLTRRNEPVAALGTVSGAATPISTSAEPAIASMASLQRLLDGYLDPKDVALVREAYRFSDQAHLGQFRSSGSPYISHPISVAEICAGWKLDAKTVNI